MQLGEASASAIIPEPEEKKEKEKKHIKIRLSVFFDGTLNNRVNIEHRTANTAVYQENKAEDNSYENDYTNVVKIERYIEVSKDDDYDTKFSIYIEGAGTTDEDDDDILGYAVGQGTNIAVDRRIKVNIPLPFVEDINIDSEIDIPIGKGVRIGKAGTGIRDKVLKGIVNSIVEISGHVKANYIIDKLTLDVIGFSRGAASARHYISEALKEYDSIYTGMEEEGVPVTKIEIHFAGLFDTVASLGAIPLLLSLPNTKSLELDAIRAAKRVVQLVAAEEHRENFSLTDIASAGRLKKGQEIFLPGVHSDIGGSYRDNLTEGCSTDDPDQDKNRMVIYKSRDKEKVSAECARLIAAGWYKPDEILGEDVSFITGRVESFAHGQVPGGKVFGCYTRLAVHRKNISHHYSRIPLHIMTRFARESGIDININLDSIEKVPKELSVVQGYIENYIARIGNSSKETDWQHNEEWLRQLRHDYLHFSAKYETGMKPRFGDSGQRKRKYFDG